jgi:tRNA-specific 2-thiouridylase
MLELRDPWGQDDALRGRSVLLAMSGGVDSSVAAVVLQSRGAHVIGLTMKNFCYSEAGAGARSCCSVSHMHDARKVCDRLGIAHHVVDTSAVFGPRVMDRFVSEYRAGRTPNPCVDCNATVRFPELLAQARSLGAELVATGHYARLGQDAAGRSYVRRARAQAKDQSYFLHGISEACLERSVFPLGEMQKDEVRELGRSQGLEVAEKPESQEICFLPDGDRAAFLTERGAEMQPGRVTDLEGHDLGTHPGIEMFTIGQRRGLGIAAGRPLFVHHLEPATRTVVLADESKLYAGGLECEEFWLRGDVVAEGLDAQIRYRHAPVPLRGVTLQGTKARLEFAAPVRAAAPGQSVVLYAGDAVVGGGRIVAPLL